MVRAALALLLLTAPAGAEGRDEALALSLIFDHCLPYASDGATPFQGIAAPAPDDPTLRALAPSFPAASRKLRLTGRAFDDHPYLAFWGTENGRRFCAVVEAGQDAPDGLRVAPDFPDRLEDGAQARGLTLDLDQTGYSRRDLRFRQPQFGEDPFRGVVLSVSVGPVGSETEHLQALGASAPELLAN